MDCQKFINQIQIIVRLIVSTIGGVTYNLVKHDADLLALSPSWPVASSHQEHLGCEQIKGIQLTDTKFITSYDVATLFTCIPRMRSKKQSVKV